MSKKILIQTGDSTALDSSGVEYHHGPVRVVVECEYCNGLIEVDDNSWECKTGGDDKDGWESICDECVDLVSLERCISLYSGKEAEHLARHAELHAYLDELISDWIDSEGRPSLRLEVLDLIKWSAKQIAGPDHSYRPHC